jgi:hypothetical protein
MTETSTGRKAALGVRCHSGWAAVILVSGTHGSVEILDRRYVELCDPEIEGSKQPFHAAEPLSFARAEAFIRRCRAATEALANRALQDVINVATANSRKLASCGVLSASGSKLPPLKDILASHPLIHAAEGEFYREAVATACERAKLPVTRIREREAFRQASDQVGLPEGQLKEWLAGWGKTMGPPWTADQKLATLAGWIALG